MFHLSKLESQNCSWIEIIENNRTRYNVSPITLKISFWSLRNSTEKVIHHKAHQLLLSQKFNNWNLPDIVEIFTFNKLYIKRFNKYLYIALCDFLYVVVLICFLFSMQYFLPLCPTFFCFCSVQCDTMFLKTLHFLKAAIQLWPASTSLKVLYSLTRLALLNRLL